MDDRQILDLYWARSETAISETAKQYGRYCHYIAYNILRNDEDSEECVNDAYWKAWEAIPPQRPRCLSAFLGTITRNLALDRYKRRKAEKRGNGLLPLTLDELLECVPASDDTTRIIEEMVLADILNRFLASLSADARNIFMRRYYYFNSIQEIAADFHISQSKVKMSLLRSRSILRKHLEKEEIFL